MGFNVDTVLKEVKRVNLSLNKLESNLKISEGILESTDDAEELKKLLLKRTEGSDVGAILARIIDPIPVLCDPEIPVLERLEVTLGLPAFQNLTLCNKKSILDSILGQTKLGRVLLKVNDEFNFISKKDIATLDNITRLASSLKDGPLLKIAAGLLAPSYGTTEGDRLNELVTSFTISKNDEEAEIAMMENIVEQSMRIGALGIFKSLDAKFKTKEQKHEVYLRAFAYAADYSRLEIIDRILDYVGVPAIRARHPNAIRRVLMGYRFPEKIGDNASPTNDDYQTQLVDLLNRIDVNWDTIQVGTRRVSNLNILRKVSDDARDLFMIGDIYDVAAAVALTHDIELLPTIVRNRHGNVLLS